jgi:hypothetical protein
MAASKNINLRLKRGQADNATDSLTTYSLMAVLAGSFFIQLLGMDTKLIFITGWDKPLALLFSGTSLVYIMVAAETVIDVFLFKDNNDPPELQKKYRRQLLYYNRGVIFLLVTFICTFWDYTIAKIYNQFADGIFASWQTTATAIQYIMLIICTLATLRIVAKRWIKDIKFIKQANIVVSHVTDGD